MTPNVYRSPQEYTLVMGSAYLYEATPYTLQYDVINITVHINFSMVTLINDVALLVINGYIPWNWPTVRAIPLNTQPEMTGTLCSISGWGKTSIYVVSISRIEGKVLDSFL